MLDLAKEIEKALEEYGDKVSDLIEEKTADVAKKAVTELKATSPKRKGKGGGKYARSWKQTEKRSELRRKARVVHNEKHYRLTHLLEYGHANVDGTRTQAYPHIGKVEEMVKKDFEKELREGIESI